MEHYCELLIISNVNQRNFYEKECINSKWNVKELKRQIDSSLYERLLLSNGDNNKEKVHELALKGNEISNFIRIRQGFYVCWYTKKGNI